eukprot:377333_1
MAQQSVIRTLFSRHSYKRCNQYSSLVLVHQSFIHKLSYDKQKNLNSIHHEAKQYTKKQFKSSPYRDEYLACTDRDEILNLVTKYQDSNDIVSHHIWAIQCLAALQEFKLCWNIFEQLSTSQQHLGAITTQLYTTMMWLSCYQHMAQSDKIRNDKLRRKKTCDKIFSLLSALRRNMNLTIDSDTITTVISSCSKLQQFGRGQGFWNKIHQSTDDAFANVTLNIDVYNAMFDLYSKSDQMNEAYDLSAKAEQYARYDHLTFAILINGAHKHGDMERAHRIFDESKAYLAPGKPSKDVYCAVMN